MKDIRASVQNQWPVSGAAPGTMLQTGIAPPELLSLMTYCEIVNESWHEGIHVFMPPPLNFIQHTKLNSVDIILPSAACDVLYRRVAVRLTP